MWIFCDILDFGREIFFYLVEGGIRMIEELNCLVFVKVIGIDIWILVFV